LELNILAHFLRVHVQQWAGNTSLDLWHFPPPPPHLT
jgi:hypothetical protein